MRLAPVPALLLLFPLISAAEPAENKTISRRLIEEAWVHANPGAARAAFASRYISHDPRQPQLRAKTVEDYIATAHRW